MLEDLADARNHAGRVPSKLKIVDAKRNKKKTGRGTRFDQDTQRNFAIFFRSLTSQFCKKCFFFRCFFFNLFNSIENIFFDHLRRQVRYKISFEEVVHGDGREPERNDDSWWRHNVNWFRTPKCDVQFLLDAIKVICAMDSCKKRNENNLQTFYFEQYRSLNIVYWITLTDVLSKSTRPQISKRVRIRVLRYQMIRGFKKEPSCD